MQATNTEFLRMFEQIVMAPPESLSGTESLDMLEDWDSMSVVVFIAQADVEFSVTVSRDDILRCHTVNDLSDLLGNKIDA